jgi:hypothetical protein
MKTVPTISEYLETHYPDSMSKILLADGFEEAFLGVVESFGSEPRACYDVLRCYDILMNRDGMDYDEAAEYMDFNVLQVYVGEHTPAFIHLNCHDVQISGLLITALQNPKR